MSTTIPYEPDPDFVGDIAAIVEAFTDLALDWYESGSKGAMIWHGEAARLRSTLEAICDPSADPNESAEERRKRERDEDRHRRWRNQNIRKRQPRCEATRVDGRPCGQTRKPKSPFCRLHADAEMLTYSELDRLEGGDAM